MIPGPDSVAQADPAPCRPAYTLPPLMADTMDPSP